MSLVTSILESFSGGEMVTESVVNPDAYANATVEGIECDYTMLECLNTIINVDRVIGTADVVGSMSMLLEGTDVTAAMEGLIANAFEKIKHAFVKMKDTIVAWFKKVIDWIISFTKNGKEFVSKYGDVIKKKDLSGFKYTGYVWTKSAGDAVVDKAAGKIMSLCNGMISDLAKAADENADSLTYTKTSDHGKDYKTKVIKDLGIGGDTIGEMKSAVTKAYRNGKDSIDSDLTLSSGQVNEYLSYIETGKELIKSAKKAQSEFEKQLNAVIKTINSIERKEDKGGDKAKNAQAVSKCLNDIFLVKRQLHDAQMASYRTMLKAETAVLRKFLNWNPKKKDEPVQNSAFDDFYELFAANPMLESDSIAVDDTELIEECDDFTAEESTNMVAGSELFAQISNMLGI